MTDYIVIAALVALAAFLLYRRLRGGLKGEGSSCCGGGASCACGSSDPGTQDKPAQEGSPEPKEHCCEHGCDGGCSSGRP